MEHQPLKVCQSFSNRWFVWFFLSKTQICNQMTHNTTQLQLLLWTAISRLIIQDAEFWRRQTLKLGSKATETKANRRDKHPAIRLRWYIPSYFQHQTLCVTFVMTLRILSAGLLCKNYTTGESIIAGFVQLGQHGEWSQNSKNVRSLCKNGWRCHSTGIFLGCSSSEQWQY